MNQSAFTTAYQESRNGTNQFYRHSLSRSFIYSDGVKECADAGCHWLLDILATELPGEFRRHPKHTMCIVTVQVADEEAMITGEFYDGDEAPYKRSVTYTDLPAGKWRFYVTKDDPDQPTLRCILPTEY